MDEDDVVGLDATGDQGLRVGGVEAVDGHGGLEENGREDRCSRVGVVVVVTRRAKLQAWTGGALGVIQRRKSTP